MTRGRDPRRLLPLLVALGVAVAACQGDDPSASAPSDPAPAPEAPATDPAPDDPAPHHPSTDDDPATDDDPGDAPAPQPTDEDRLEAVRGRLDGSLGGEASVELADLLRGGVLALRDVGHVDASDGIPWGGWSADEVTWGREANTSDLRMLHSLLFVNDLVATGRDEDLVLALEKLRDWVDANPRGEPAHRMAWHDETTARRTQALVRLHDGLTRDDETRDDPRWDLDLAWIEDLIHDHVDLLLDDDFHATGTNHGMFQDRAVLAAEEYVRVRRSPRGVPAGAREVARDRLLAYYDELVSDDGVHLEHSPSYHQLIAGSAQRDAAFFEAVGDTDTAERLLAVHASMVAYATHVIQPDGTWPLLADTFPRSGPNPELWDDPGYRWAATGGEEGRPPRERAALFPGADYVILRDRWGDDGRGTYLHLTAAYHTDYHKHADDLSLWLYHDGPLLTELGPAGYQMADPQVICAYSQWAHNTVTVDGLELPRTDGNHDGTRLDTTDLDGPPWTVSAVNDRLEGATIRRTLTYDPDTAQVEVVDEVTLDTPRVVRARWHLDPTVTAEVDGTQVRLAQDGAADVDLRFEADTEVAVELIGPSLERCAGLRFGEDEPIDTSTLELATPPVAEVTLRHHVDLSGVSDRQDRD